MRMKIGVMFGSPETTTGGNALKFYASLRLDIRRIGAIKEAAVASGKDPIAVGNRTRVKVVKNKLAPPFREIEFDILYGQGISRSGDLIDLGSELGIVEKSGAWFSFGSDRIGQGRENAKAYFEQHPELMDKVEAMILAKHGIKRNTPPGTAEGAGGSRPASAGSAHTAPASATNGAGPERLDEKASKKPAIHVGSAKN
jgi:recombination protein RecA